MIFDFKDKLETGLVGNSKLSGGGFDAYEGC